MSKVSLWQRWKKTSLPNKLMVISTGIMAFATVCLVVAGILQYLAAREQLQAVREQANIMRAQLESMKSSSKQTQDLIAATQQTANASQSVAEQNKELVKHAGEQAAASQTQANASVAQAEAARQTAIAVGSSAKATERSAEVAAQSFLVGERPYVSVQNINFVRFTVGQTAAVEVVFINRGKTPAYLTNQNTITLQQRSLTEADFHLRNLEPVNTVIVLPNEPVKIEYEADWVLTPARLDALMAKTAWFYVYGIGFYDDAAKQRHRFTYCGVYDPKTKFLILCDSGNTYQ